VAMLAAFDFASLFTTITNILLVALGLGLVIFFHEMGHFLAAKWCNVNVERFSIGFGPILWRRKWGETEYAFSLIPFGGYVKMLGQDDLDPSQLSSEEIAEDPRSYSSKPVRQRMLIISAGVVVNVITAMFFFAIAFQLGVESIPAVAGSVRTGMPAWEAGQKRGDKFTRINGRKVESFSDIMRGVALSTEDVVVEGVSRDGKTFKFRLEPDTSGTRRIIGVGRPQSLQLARLKRDQVPPTASGTPAASADPPFQDGDILQKIDDVPIKDYFQYQDLIALKRKEPLDYHVKRKGQLVKIRVAPNKFRTLGLWMDIGPIVSVQDGSPAQLAGIRKGDQIVSFNDKVIGTALNPLKLNEQALEKFADNDDVVIQISRPVAGGNPEEKTFHIRPDNEPAWIDPRSDLGAPYTIPSLGIAFDLKPTIMHVEENSPAADKGIVPNERLLKMVLHLPQGAKPDNFNENEDYEIDFSKEEQPEKIATKWADAFRMMQLLPTRKVTLTVANNVGKTRPVELTPQRDEDWFAPERGLHLTILTEERQAENLGRALAMGFTYTQNTLGDLYATLRNLFSGRLSVKELHGPIGIAEVAYDAADYGLPQLLLFLGFLSVNLAVLNFLPIPVLDGGHMVFLCWEAVTRKRPSERVLIAATYCGMAFVLGLMCLVIYLDIFVHR